MGQYTVRHQSDHVCAECERYYVDGKTDVDQCVKGHNDRVGRLVLACDDFIPDQYYKTEEN